MQPNNNNERVRVIPPEHIVGEILSFEEETPQQLLAKAIQNHYNANPQGNACKNEALKTIKSGFTR